MFALDLATGHRLYAYTLDPILEEALMSAGGPDDALLAILADCVAGPLATLAAAGHPAVVVCGPGARPYLAGWLGATPPHVFGADEILPPLVVCTPDEAMTA